MEKIRILVVEDDFEIGHLIDTTLKNERYSTSWCKNGGSALESFKIFRPTLILLDLMLPDIDGIEVIRSIRKFSLTPIIVVSARSAEKDKIAALDEGADDYLVKPFSINELLARVRVAERRNFYLFEESQSEKRMYINGNLKIDYLTRQVSLADKPIELTATLYKLLCLFAKNTSKVLTHGYIFHALWPDKQQEDSTSLRVAIASLRKKIEPGENKQRYIQTHIGVGYSFKQN